MDAAPNTLAASALPGDASLLASVQRIEAEAGGAANLDVIRPCDLPFWNAFAQGGHVRAQVALDGAAAVRDRIAAAAPGGGPRCAGCARCIEGGTFGVVVAAAPDNATNSLTAVVCGDCATEPGAMRETALSAFRMVWPQMRILPPIHPAVGHA